MSSRDEILRRIRKSPAAAGESPGEFINGIQFADPVAEFSNVLAGVGGRCEVTETADRVRSVIDELIATVQAHKVCSLVPSVNVSSFALESIDDPHDLDDVDLAIVRGELAVAENGAVWVAPHNDIVRTLLFLSQHLAIVVSAAQVVSNLHQAYARLDVSASEFGTWISGPSKTADIEQSLVLGAHGARSLTVIISNDAA